MGNFSKFYKEFVLRKLELQEEIKIQRNCETLLSYLKSLQINSSWRDQCDPWKLENAVLLTGREYSGFYNYKTLGPKNLKKNG